MQQEGKIGILPHEGQTELRSTPRDSERAPGAGSGASLRQPQPPQRPSHSATKNRRVAGGGAEPGSAPRSVRQRSRASLRSAPATQASLPRMTSGHRGWVRRNRLRVHRQLSGSATQSPQQPIARRKTKPIRPRLALIPQGLVSKTNAWTKPSRSALAVSNGQTASQVRAHRRQHQMTGAWLQEGEELRSYEIDGNPFPLGFVARFDCPRDCRPVPGLVIHVGRTGLPGAAAPGY